MKIEIKLKDIELCNNCPLLMVGQARENSYCAFIRKYIWRDQDLDNNSVEYHRPKECKEWYGE